MNISANIRRLTNLFIIFFLALSGGLVYWQVVVAQQVTANPHNIRHCLADAAPVRGRIFDRNGVLLAESKPSNSGCGYLRHYNEPSLAGLIGYYISSLYSSIGIGEQYDDYLTGKIGLTGLDNTINQTLHRPPVGADIYLTIDVRVQRIVDHFFDADANVYPPDGFNRFPTDRGSVIVTDPHTGQIIAMLSRPGYDPNKVVTLEKVNPNDPNSETYYDMLTRDPKQPLAMRPLDFRYVPGSTYKTLTLLAGLDSGAVQLSDQFDKGHALGPVVIGGPNGSPACITLPPKSCGENSEKFGPTGNNIEGYTFNFPVELRYGFAHSDNIIFAQVGAKTGVQTWLDYNNRFYVGKQIPFDLPVTPSRVSPANGELSNNGLAENAFGQGVDFVTPMQMSLFDDAIANDGHLMRPSVILKIVDPSGTVVRSFSPQELGTPISAQTASQMRDAMYGVVRCGSGSIVAPLISSPWAIIAKTGTGEVGGGKAANAWLISQAPYQNPVLTITSMKENGGEGGYINGPMQADIYNAIFSNPAIKEWKPNLPPPPNPQYCFQTGLLQR